MVQFVHGGSRSVNDRLAYSRMLAGEDRTEGRVAGKWCVLSGTFVQFAVTARPSGPAIGFLGYCPFRLQSLPLISEFQAPMSVSIPLANRFLISEYLPTKIADAEMAKAEAVSIAS